MTMSYVVETCPKTIWTRDYKNLPQSYQRGNRMIKWARLRFVNGCY